MKHAELISKMTLEEKAAILSGMTVWQTRNYDRLGIPSIFCSDGPHGIRKQAGAGDHLGLNASLPATCFPTAATVANSWDEALGEAIGAALGEEAASQEVNVLLGPGLNIKRSPLCGRNFEYFSEDPYLAGKMAAAYVKGIQSQGIYACPKHYAVNSQEMRRMAMNSVLDERTLREIYLTGFEIAVKESKAGAIMTSYNEVNGVYANENEHLLMEILRNEWGFEGIVITDWGASNDHALGVKMRSNLEMPAPGLDSARELFKAINDGKLTMEELDQCVDDLLDAVLVLSENAKTRPTGFDVDSHHALAKKVALESTVLLKNEKNILPLEAGTKVAFVGDFAITPRYQGAGSSVVNPTKLDTIQNLAEGCGLEVVGICGGYKRTGEADDALKKEAVELAKKAEVVIYCFGLDELSESEGLDRNHMRIPQNQIDLLSAMNKVNSRIVGVMSAGSSVEMPWEHNLMAILHGYLNGQAGAGAMLDLLTGKACPCGHLNETYPVLHKESPAYNYFPSKERTAEYREGLFVGYRYYDTAGVQVQYPFGYGLSYTAFAMSDLTVDADGIEVTVTNTGKMDGAHVVQMYVSMPEGRIFRPAKELKGFKKVFVKAGESVKVSIPFDDKTFRYWNVQTDAWEVEGGTYKIMVGNDVSDIVLQKKVEVEGTGAPNPYDEKLMEDYYTGKITAVSDKAFEALLGHPIPDGHWSGALDMNDAICQLYYAKSPLARLIFKILEGIKVKSEKKGKPDLNVLFVYNMPFRAIAKMSGGMVSMDMARGMVEVVNGHFFGGIGKVIGGFFANGKANKAYEKKLGGGK